MLPPSKTPFLSFLVIAGLLAQSSAVHAGPTCPLSNPKYKTLSEAIAALSTKIKLPPQCAAKQASLQEAVDTLSSSADQLIKTSAG